MKKFRSIFLFFIFISLIIFTPIKASANDDGYYIKNMKVDVQVNEKRQFMITETIDVFFNVERHGIIRKIPKESSTERYRIHDIKCNENNEVSGDTEYKSIKIGDEDVTLKGDKRYIITYTLSHFDDEQSDGDYIYLNILGDQWDTDVKNFQGSITYPKEAKLLNLNLTSGYYGSTDNYFAKYKVEGNKILITSTERIPAYTGITANVRLNEGAFYQAIKLSDAFGAVEKYTPIASIIVIAVVIFLYLIFGETKIKDKGVSIYPPKGINSAEASYIDTLNTSPNAITTLIFYWANHNHLKINIDSKGKIKLIMVNMLDSEHRDYEIKLYNALFRDGERPEVSISTLKGKFFTHINIARAGLSRFFERENKLLETKSIIATIVALFIGVIPLWIMFIIGIKSEMVDQPILIIGMCVSLSLNILIFFILNAIYRMITNSMQKMIMPLALILSAIIYVIVMVLLSMSISMPIYIRLMLPLISYIVCVIALFIPKRTKAIRSIYEELLGFKRFIKIAEKDRLEALLEEDPEYFYNTLPYAQALGVTDKWTKKFEGLTMQPPSYYERTGGYYNNYMWLQMVNDMNKISKDVTNVPRSSSGSGGGFSGGGFSGGGSGGGGGSSW